MCNCYFRNDDDKLYIHKQLIWDLNLFYFLKSAKPVSGLEDG